MGDLNSLIINYYVKVCYLALSGSTSLVCEINSKHTEISFQIMVLEYRIPLLHEVNRSPTLQPFLWLVRRILLTFSISYALVSFCMLTHDKYLQVRGHVFWNVSFVTPLISCLLLWWLDAPIHYLMDLWSIILDVWFH